MQELIKAHKSISTSRIGVDPARNVCRVMRALFSTVIPEVLKYARYMVEDGFKTDESLVVEPIDKDTGKRFAEIRQAAFEALDTFKDTVVHALGEKFTVTANDIRESVRRTFGDAKGNFGNPDIGLVADYTRMSALVFANAVRQKIGKPLITEVPCVLFNRTLTEAERMAENVNENTKGGKEPIPYGIELQIVKDYVAGDLHTMSEACRLMGYDPQKDSSFRQGTATMLKLDAEYPELDVIGRFAKGEIQHKRSRYSHAKVIKWLQPNKETGQYANGKVEKPTAEEILEFLQNPNAQANPDEQKPLTPSQLQKAAQHTKNAVKRFCIDAIRSGDTENLKKLENGSEAYSLCHQLIQQGHGEAVLAALKQVHVEVWKASDSK